MLCLIILWLILQHLRELLTTFHRMWIFNHANTMGSNLTLSRGCDKIFAMFMLKKTSLAGGGNRTFPWVATHIVLLLG